AYNMSAGGLGIDGTSDSFTYNYQQRVGDFDVMMRVQSLSLADTWSSAGLMARETLTAGSRYYASAATPGASGCFFQYRSTASTVSTKSGYAPVTFPSTWLRLQRVGNTFNGFYSTDGTSWQSLGTIAGQALPSQIYVGMFAASRTNGVATVAELRDYTDVIGTPAVA